MKTFKIMLVPVLAVMVAFTSCDTTKKIKDLDAQVDALKDEQGGEGVELAANSLRKSENWVKVTVTSNDGDVETFVFDRIQDKGGSNSPYAAYETDYQNDNNDNRVKAYDYLETYDLTTSEQTPGVPESELDIYMTDYLNTNDEVQQSNDYVDFTAELYFLHEGEVVNLSIYDYSEVGFTFTKMDNDVNGITISGELELEEDGFSAKVEYMLKSKNTK